MNIKTWNERDMINVQTSGFATSDEFNKHNHDIQHTLLHVFHPLSLRYLSLPKLESLRSTPCNALIFPFLPLRYIKQSIPFFALVNTETWNERDMINVQTSGFATSDEFNKYNHDV